MSCLVNDDRSDAGRLFHVVGPWIAEERNQPTFAAVAISLRAPSTYRDRPSVGVSPLDIPPPHSVEQLRNERQIGHRPVVLEIG